MAPCMVARRLHGGPPQSDDDTIPLLLKLKREMRDEGNCSNGSGCGNGRDEASVSGINTCTNFQGHAWQTIDASFGWSRSIQRGARSDDCIRATKPTRGS